MDATLVTSRMESSPDSSRGVRQRNRLSIDMMCMRPLPHRVTLVRTRSPPEWRVLLAVAAASTTEVMTTASAGRAGVTSARCFGLQLPRWGSCSALVVSPSLLSQIRTRDFGGLLRTHTAGVLQPAPTMRFAWFPTGTHAVALGGQRSAPQNDSGGRSPPLPRRSLDTSRTAWVRDEAPSCRGNPGVPSSTPLRGVGPGLRGTALSDPRDSECRRRWCCPLAEPTEVGTWRRGTGVPVVEPASWRVGGESFACSQPTPGNPGCRATLPVVPRHSLRRVTLRSIPLEHSGFRVTAVPCPLVVPRPRFLLAQVPRPTSTSRLRAPAAACSRS